MDQQPFIAGRLEALFAATWLPVISLGFLIGSVVTPVGWVLVPLGFLGAGALLWHVQRRIQLPPEDRRLLRIWLSTRGQYAGWMVLFGKTPPGANGATTRSR